MKRGLRRHGDLHAVRRHQHHPRLYLYLQRRQQRDLQPQRRLLSAPNEYVGYSGTGNFTQSGGTNTIPAPLRRRQCSSGSGTYSLSGRAVVRTG